jgi:hypothetical protein
VTPDVSVPILAAGAVLISAIYAAHRMREASRALGRILNERQER